MVIPFPRHRRHPVTADQMREAVRASLLLADSPEDRHGTYTARARMDERRARAALSPRSGNVENVVPLHAPTPDPPHAA